MPNFPMELSLNNTTIQQLSTALCRQRESSSNTTSLFKCDRNRSNVSGDEKLATMLIQEYQEEGKGEEEKVLPLEDLIRQLRSDLQQTRALVSELETRLKLTEQTSQVIIGELKTLLSENESESHTTVVEIDRRLDDIDIDLGDNEFCISSSLINQTHQEEIHSINNEREEITCSNLLPQSGSPTKSLEPSITQNADDTTDSFNRICDALQNLINDGQVALQKPNSSSSNQLLGFPQTTTRPRAHSWSSNVSSWIISQYNSSPAVICECGSCWLCLESNSNNLSSTTTPKSSRASSISSTQNPCLSLKSQQQDKTQVNLAGIKKQYRKKFERSFDYRKSCDDLEMELQKLITTAISTGVEHGLMHSPVYRQHHCMEHDDSSSTSDYNYFGNHVDGEMSDESYDEFSEEKFSRFSKCFPKSFEIFCKHEQFKKLENTIISDNDNDNGANDNEKKTSKWRRYIWNGLQKMGVMNFNSNIENVIEEEEGNDDNENSGYSSYSSYNSSWNSSSRDYQENLNEDSSNPFPSSFINTLIVGQNIFNFNVNLINSTTNNYNNKTINNHFNEIDNSTHTTNNYYNYKTSTDNNNNEGKSSLNTAKEDFTLKRTASKKFQSLSSKYMNFLAMMGLMVSMSQSIVSHPMARYVIRSSVKRRRSRSDMILMIKVIKYVAVLFVGWAAGRIGKKQKNSSDENNRITEIPSNTQ